MCKITGLAGGNQDLIKELFLQTRDQLDEPAVWSAVEALARALIDRLENEEVTILADEAEAIVQNVLGQCGHTIWPGPD